MFFPLIRVLSVSLSLTSLVSACATPAADDSDDKNLCWLTGFGCKEDKLAPLAPFGVEHIKPQEAKDLMFEDGKRINYDPVNVPDKFCYAENNEWGYAFGTERELINTCIKEKKFNIHESWEEAYKLDPDYCKKIWSLDFYIKKQKGDNVEVWKTQGYKLEKVAANEGGLLKSIEVGPVENKISQTFSQYVVKLLPSGAISGFIFVEIKESDLEAKESDPGFVRYHHLIRSGRGPVYDAFTIKAEIPWNAHYCGQTRAAYPNEPNI